MSPHVHGLERSRRIPRRRDEVFAFFAEASNLEAIGRRFESEAPVDSISSPIHSVAAADQPLPRGRP